jgi:hypothetical protein
LEVIHSKYKARKRCQVKKVNIYPHLKAISFRLIILLPSDCQDSLIVERVLRVSEIKDDTGMRLGSTTIGKLFAEVNGTVENKTSILLEIDVKRLEVSRGVDDTDLAGLNEIIGDNQVLLVGGDLDVVGSDGGLVLIRVIKTLDVVQVANIESSDVVGGGQGGVEVLAVLADVGAGGYC